MTAAEIDIPEEILDKLQSFHEALKNVDEMLRPLTTININSSDVQMSPLDKARLNLSCGYALNSLFWMYLNTQGIDPKEHSIKTELERYKSFMLRVKEITDKDKAPTLDKAAAGRFVRNALWKPKEKEAEETDGWFSFS
ncbi:nuclear nucleic acid-binding protein C1D-like [Uloborus diversus]|uniref:nuclear nucleic acid-binding protein C1D-like n=1 Tax=Uloborus diversus TaxID=327109 RepID=UPI002409902A|nr:nuclear nucleic acid-binding protein C1D-like [Uloborus diversus]